MAADPASLDDLFDIVTPPPVPIWPPAPGWYVVGGVVALLAVWMARRIWERRRAATYRRAALAELEALHARAAAPGDRDAAMRALAPLVKRTALAAFAREDVAALSGADWLRFLDRTGRTDAFTAGRGRALAEVAYDPAAVAHMDGAETEELFRVVRRWIETHVVSPASGR